MADQWRPRSESCSRRAVVVADLYDLRQREVGSQLLVLRPGDPEHTRALEVGLELRKRVLELRPGPREKVDVVELPASSEATSSLGGSMASTAVSGALTKIARTPSSMPILSDAVLVTRPPTRSAYQSRQMSIRLRLSVRAQDLPVGRVVHDARDFTEGVRPPRSCAPPRRTTPWRAGAFGILRHRCQGLASHRRLRGIYAAQKAKVSFSVCCTRFSTGDQVREGLGEREAPLMLCRGAPEHIRETSYAVFGGSEISAASSPTAPHGGRSTPLSGRRGRERRVCPETRGPRRGRARSLQRLQVAGERVRF